MDYNKTSQNYKGSTFDNLNRLVHGFEIEDEIHLVYNLGESNQYVSKKPTSEIKENLNNFLWTPYIEFVK